MRLKDVFTEKLRENGISKIGTRMKWILSSADPIRAMAVAVANGDAKVLKGDGGIGFSFTFDGKYLQESPEAYVGNRGEPIFGKEELIQGLDLPFIAIDCRFYELHSEKEKKKLRLQITKTLGTIREFMWDEKLIVAGKDFGVGFYCDKLEDFLLSNGIEEVILLDPKGDKLFDRKKAKCYVIGGIVDKAEEKDLTSLIGDELEKAGIRCDRRRIELRGSIIGVPDRINHIAEIVLRFLLDCEDLEKAIRSVQPITVAKWRLRKELPKKSLRVRIGNKTIRVVSKETFKEFDWLNLRLLDLYDVCREQKLYVVSEEVMKKLIELEWDEKRRSYFLR
ncbi:MAG: tRNA (guanine-N1)-methyltransferase [Archaeoglobaceae archaeon]|nr:tRNA (guanine-N1)-methyltransferase [Archaeoglobaceae archaeon]MDW8127981.1 tRNA (guanine-N1)-methyltransferase [Archaeoglobaceae archaeon]